MRKALALAAAIAVCAAVLVLPQVAAKLPVFSGAESYQFYVGSVSSNADIVAAEGAAAAAVKLTLGGVTGESARYADARDAFAQAEALDARLCLCERAGDVVNYYYRSPRLGGGVEVGGMTVNLHVAVRGGSASIGTPLIFGGY